MITTDKILKEYFMRRDDGGAFFDVENYDDLHHFETFLLEHDYMGSVDKEKLNELFGSSKMGATVDKGASFVKSKLSHLWNKIAQFVKSGYRQIVSSFKRYVKSIETTIGNHNLEDTFYVNIPSIEEPNIRDFEKVGQEISSVSPAGDLDEVSEKGATAYKGYYNEALTALYIVQKNKTPVKVRIISEVIEEIAHAGDDEMIVVQLEDERGPEIVKIKNLVSLRDSQLRKAAGNTFDDIKKQIELASNDMSDYLISTVGSTGGVILEVAATGDTDLGKTKADIRLKIKKGAKQSYRAWSLKMYQGRDVNLLNTGLDTVVEDICGKEFVPKLQQLKAQGSNRAYHLYREVRSSADRIKETHKKKKLDAEGCIKRLAKFTLPSAENAPPVEDKKRKIMREPAEIVKSAIKSIRTHPNDFDAVQDDLRQVRDLVGNGANPYVAHMMAQIVEYCLNSGKTNKDIFSSHLLDKLGFSDKDTEFLMALVGSKQMKAGKSDLINEHPELDLDNLGVAYNKGSVVVTLVNTKLPEGKNKIMSFNAKEGGTIATKVKFDAPSFQV